MTFDFTAPPDQPPCTPTGLTGEWWAATGEGNGWEQWRVDLSRYAGQVVEVSLAYASDEIVQEDGVEIDAISVSTGEGTSSFENGDTGGWQVPGAPPGSFNDNDWFVGAVDDLPPTLGEKATSVLEREGEFLSFLASVYGEYPFRDAGAIVHAVDVGFALENQTRPTYPGGVFTFDGTSTVVHELAHQWVGDLVRVDLWQHIWLNEGFATYSEWLWAEHEGTFTTDDFFDFYYNIFPDDHPFWQVVVADPGPVQMFNFPIYGRGAMTLHRLRRTVGDDAFFTILRQWTRVHCDEGRTGTTSEFIALAETVSGMDLGDLFQAWLFTPAKPALPAAVEGLRLVSPAAATADPRFRLLRTADHVRR